MTQNAKRPGPATDPAALTPRENTTQSTGDSAGQAESRRRAEHAAKVYGTDGRDAVVIPVHAVGPDGKTCSCPSGANCEDAGKHPIGNEWQTATETPWHRFEELDRKGRRYNVGILVKPSGLLVVDIDPRNGGFESSERLSEEHGPFARTLMLATGSGGQHLAYRRPAGVEFKSKIDGYPGIDIKHSGIVVALGSVSHAGPYSMLDDAPITDPDEWLIELVTRPAYERPQATTERVARDDLDPAERDRLARVEKAAVAGEVGRLDAMEAAKVKGWSEGNSNGYRGDDWNNTTFEVACSLLELAQSDWTALTPDEAEALVLDHAPRDEGFGDAEILKRIESARNKVTGKVRPYPAAPTSPLDAATKTTTTATKATAKAADADEEKKDRQTAAEMVANIALERFSVGRTDGGEAYAVAKAGADRSAIMLGAKGGGLRQKVTAIIYAKTGKPIAAEALTNGLAVVVALALNSDTATPVHLRAADLGDRLVLDLGQPGNSRCVIVTADGWHVADQPPAGVIFRRPGTLRPLPDPSRDGSLEPLRRILGFEAGDPRWLLVAGWLPASLRCTTPRPLLLMLGAAGSGKTSRGHAVVNVLDPRAELGSSFGRNLDDDRTKAWNSFLLGYDNLTSISEQVSDQVCRTVTGDAAEKRRNYSDTDVVVMSYRRTGVMTAITAPALRPDALERVIPIVLEPMPPGARRSEADLARTFEAAHPAILGAVLDDAARMLAGLPDAIHRSDGPRMLDFWQSLTAINPALAAAYADSAADVLTTAAEEDPFVVAVRDWVRATGRGHSLNNEATPTAEHASFVDFVQRRTGYAGEVWIPKNARAMSSALTRSAGTLAALGVSFRPEKSNGVRVWRFYLEDES